MTEIFYNIIGSYTFVYILMPLIGAFLCMMCNTTNAKDHQIPATFEEKWKRDLFDVTNFMTIWLIIMIIMQVYKAFLIKQFFF